MLATTGLITLRTSAHSDLNGETTHVPVGETPQALSAQQAAAEVAIPGSPARQYIAPMSEDRAAVFRVGAGDTATTVLTDPYTARVVDAFPWRAGLYDMANEIQGTLLLGTLGDRLIEIAASLAVLPGAIGIYLHWPRNGQGAGTLLVPNLAARGRALWKSLHGVVGFWISAVLLVFLISGLSWAGIWGERMVQAGLPSRPRSGTRRCLTKPMQA